MRPNRILLDIVLLCGVALFAVSCLSNNGLGGDGDTESETNQSYESTLELSIEDDIWRYISLSMGEVVGQSLFGDDEMDAEWAKRSDWDIALCNGFIRTNSGSSGSGSGGIQISDVDYDDIESVPQSGYSVDSVFGGEQ